MVTQMTNRLLATVMTFAVSTGIAAHAAKDPVHALPGVTVTAVAAPTVPGHTVAAPKVTVTVQTVSLPAATSLPQAVQVAANHVADAATAAVDPTAAVRAAFQRDHVALEHLRQLGSGLNSRARQAFNQRISDNEARLVEIEKTALASRTQAASSITDMDSLVASVNGSLAAELARERDQKSGDNKSGNNQNHQAQN